MSDDLVARLREAEEHGNPVGILLEAADEIERLRSMYDQRVEEAYGLRAEIERLRAENMKLNAENALSDAVRIKDLEIRNGVLRADLESANRLLEPLRAEVASLRADLTQAHRDMAEMHRRMQAEVDKVCAEIAPFIAAATIRALKHENPSK